MLINRTPKRLEQATEIISIDKQTLQHTERVSALTTEYTKFLAWTEKKVNGIKTIAYLHDLGKTAVVDVMNKRRRLNDEEYRTMRLHTVFGFIIAHKMGVKNELLIPILSHHNNFVQTNYVTPKELKVTKDEIYERAKSAYQISDLDISLALAKLKWDWDKYNLPSFESRILTLWDSFDAATGTGRAYMRNKKATEIVEEFSKLFGMQFDNRLESSFIGFTHTKEYKQLIDQTYHHSVR